MILKPPGHSFPILSLSICDYYSEFDVYHPPSLKKNNNNFNFMCFIHRKDNIVLYVFKLT